MNCALYEVRIAELEAEVVRLKRLVGENADELVVHSICEFMRRVGEQRSPGAARVMAALYAASGKPVSIYSLMEAVPPTYSSDSQDRQTNLISVWVSVIRKRFGYDAVETIRQRGYRITEAGAAKVEEIISGRAGAGSHPVAPPLTLSR